MAAIGSIRKHGVLLMVIIGFALLLFLLTGLFDNNTIVKYLHSDEFTMAKIDGKVADDEYRKIDDQLVILFKLLRDRSSLDETETFQAHQVAWDQLVDEKILEKQLDGLGIVFNKDMNDEIMANAKASLSTQQANPYLGAFVQHYLNMGVPIADIQSILSQIDELATDERYVEIYKQYKAIERRILFEHKMYTIYRSLSQGAVYFSDELAKKYAKDNVSLTANVLTASATTPAFNDIQIEVSEKEMKNWYKAHSLRYKITEDSRDLSIAVIPILPTPEDKQRIEDSVRTIYAQFSNLPLDSFNMVRGYSLVDSLYHKKGENLAINTPGGYIGFNNIAAIDSFFFSRPAGALIEPYNYQDGVWLFGKTFGHENRPDSILVAMLIVNYQTSQNKEIPRKKSRARHESDSLIAQIASGQTNIFQLTPSYLGNREVTDTTIWLQDNMFGGILTKNLYNTLMHLPDGALYKDEVPGAFVIYQVLTRTRPVEKRQYALYATDIVASEATIANLRNQANQLATGSNNAADFIEKVNNAGVQLVQGTNVTSMAASVNGLSQCRSIVSWAFSKDNTATFLKKAKKGEKGIVSDVYKLDNGVFAVATVSEVKNKDDNGGILPFDAVRKNIEDELKSMKKIEAIQVRLQEDVTAGMSTRDIAQKYNLSVRDSAMLSFGNEFYMNAGVENRAIGCLFAKAAEDKHQVIAAQNNVYVIDVLGDVKEAPAPTPDLRMEKSMIRNVVLGRGRDEMQLIECLKNKIPIWDNRARFYQN
ncbi:MAG: SurA N-terminal domain-containing protein [Bacteroidales bacterium]|jgi:peptidyl-prolyl cis-trans isomerase D|nr:SurA N-terminal domain-containing protein [Bacteroidales bacterium]